MRDRRRDPDAILEWQSPLEPRRVTLARPGEFTLRAFLNGRIDLVQAEAVADLVETATPLQARVAFDQLEGALADAGRGRLIREGRTAVIADKANVCKPSVFNYLAGIDRTIVSPEPGTTRDVASERIDLEEIPRASGSRRWLRGDVSVEADGRTADLDLASVETEVKHQGYLKRQRAEVARRRSTESQAISARCQVRWRPRFVARGSPPPEPGGTWQISERIVHPRRYASCAGGAPGLRRSGDWRLGGTAGSD